MVQLHDHLHHSFILEILLYSLTNAEIIIQLFKIEEDTIIEAFFYTLERLFNTSFWVLGMFSVRVDDSVNAAQRLCLPLVATTINL